jgi:hypothetical protein
MPTAASTARRANCDAAALAEVRHFVHEQPDAPLAELCERLWTQQRVRVSVPTMGRIVLALQRPRKKSRSTRASVTPSGSNRRGPTTRKKLPRSTPNASSSSMNRASTSP